jgi:bifunctional DNA-binding transcriptional regulator/antitoxin component of YhaV-PrlF toxin-antitoxin module
MNAEPPPEEWDVVQTDTKVFDSGLLTIAGSSRQRHGIEPNDAVSIEVETPDVSFYAPDLRVNPDGAVRIPTHQRNLYGVRDGDWVTLRARKEDIEYDPRDDR